MKEGNLYNGIGYCHVVDHLGNDWTPVKAARQSYGKPLKGVEADTKLLRYLLEHGHTSPLEQASITWQIRMPIFVMRQFVRHRTFRLNELSARYTTLSDDYYLPKEWRKQDTKNKQSSVDADEAADWHADNTLIASRACEVAFDAYNRLLSEGVARELARIVLPVNVMTEVTVNIDLHNLMGFFKKRLHPGAQEEIQELARCMLQQASELFPVSFGIFRSLVEADASA